MNKRSATGVVGVLLAGAIAPAWYALGCPFCTSVAQTFSEEFATMDAVVIAQLEQLPEPSTETTADRQAGAPVGDLHDRHKCSKAKPRSVSRRR